MATLEKLISISKNWWDKARKNKFFSSKWTIFSKIYSYLKINIKRKMSVPKIHPNSNGDDNDNN